MIKVQFRHLDVPTWIHDHEHGTRFVYTNNRHPDDLQVVRQIYVNGWQQLQNLARLYELRLAKHRAELQNADFILRNPRI